MQLPEELFSVEEALKMLAGALKRLGDIHGYSVLLPLFLFFWTKNTLFLYVYYHPVLDASFRHGPLMSRRRSWMNKAGAE